MHHPRNEPSLPSLNHGHELRADIPALAAEAATVLGHAASGKATTEAIATLRAQFEVAHARFSELYGEAKQRTQAQRRILRAVA